jgi:2-desacetyl-2-hydroxyethyl bacteriochlorophyllide A dehydrogenase
VVIYLVTGIVFTCLSKKRIFMTEQMISAAFYRGKKTFTVEQTKAAQPGPGEVAVRIAFCGICGTDMHVYHGNMDARVGHNRVVGHEMSGTVAGIGEGVDGFTFGQKVVVRPLDHCGACPACDAGHTHICHKLKFLGLDTDGAMQEIWSVPAHTLHHLPDALRLDHAALIEPVAVACHDVRLADLQAGEDVVVIGGGPIGVLVAMVARDAGGKVVISEVNPYRIEIAKKLDFETVNPAEQDLAGTISEMTSGKGADVVFEVSGTQKGVDAMTAIAATRARIVMVAIHAQKPEIDLFQFFWRELQLLGARVYEAADYDKAIAIITAGGVDADTIITDISPLRDIQAAFEALDSSPTAMKSLIRVGNDT